MLVLSITAKIMLNFSETENEKAKPEHKNKWYEQANRQYLFTF